MRFGDQELSNDVFISTSPPLEKTMFTTNQIDGRTQQDLNARFRVHDGARIYN